MKRNIFLGFLLLAIAVFCFELFGSTGNVSRLRWRLFHPQITESCSKIHGRLFEEGSRGLSRVWREISGGEFVWDLRVEDVKVNIVQGVMVQTTCIPKSSIGGFDLVIRFPMERIIEAFELKPGDEIRVSGILYDRMAGVIYAEAH